MSELRLHGIDSLEAANAFLPAFIADHNRRFARPPATSAAVWRACPADLALVLSCRYGRTVARDNTVRLGARWVQLPRGPQRRSHAGRHVEVRELLDGRLVVLAEGARLATAEAPTGEFVLKPRRAAGAERRRLPRTLAYPPRLPRTLPRLAPHSHRLSAPRHTPLAAGL